MQSFRFLFVGDVFPQDEHKSEIANWKRKNSELLKKMRSKAKLAAGEVEDEAQLLFLSSAG